VFVTDVDADWLLHRSNSFWRLLGKPLRGAGAGPRQSAKMVGDDGLEPPTLSV
jgi:hypothetical protein